MTLESGSESYANQRHTFQGPNYVGLDDLELPSEYFEYYAEFASSPGAPSPTDLLFPKSVTAEQKAYADGFAHALDEIYRINGRPRAETSVDREKSVGIGSFGDMSNSCESLASETADISWFVPAAAGSFPGCDASRVPGSMGHWSNWEAGQVFGYGDYTGQLNAAASSSYIGQVNHQVNHPFYTSPNHCDSVAHHGQLLEGSTSYAGNWVHDQSAFFRSALPVAATSSGPFQDAVVRQTPDPATATAPSSPSSTVDAADAADDSMVVARRKPKSADADDDRLERKRARNRLAAARCQTRKVERIGKLQDRVDELRNRKAQLARIAAELRNDVSSLKQEIMMHAGNGCRLLVPSASYF